MAKHRPEPRQHRIIAVHVDGHQIAKIRFTDAKGVKMTDWPVAKAVKAIERGTDEFLVATTVWSPVKVRSRKGAKHLRTVRDSCDHSNLLNLPHF